MNESIIIDEPGAPKCSKCAALCCKLFNIGLTEEEKEMPLFKAVAINGELHAPCPFLSSNNACTIYANRPAVCRKYDCRTDERNLNAPNEPELKGEKTLLHHLPYWMLTGGKFYKI